MHTKRQQATPKSDTSSTSPAKAIHYKVDFGVLYGFLETNQTNEKKPAVWRNHTKAKGRKKPGQLFYFFLTLNAVLIE